MSQPDSPPPNRFGDGVSDQRFDAQGGPVFPTGRSRSGCWIGCILLGIAFALFVCCGGGALLVHFGIQMVTREVEDQLVDNPVLKEHVGEVQSFEVDWSQSLAEEDEDTFVYRVRGAKGKGLLIVKHITSPDGNEQVVSAQLRMSTGETFDLLPDRP